MFYSPEKLRQNAKNYCLNHSLTMAQPLGQGTQGMVFSTTRESAIKVHAQHAAYLRERDVYLRLRERLVQQVHGLTVPRLHSFDDNLLIIEMTLVSPPFILDFGGAYLDSMPSHMAEPRLRDQWIEEKSEQFGDNFSKVKTVLQEFQVLHQIYIADVNPGNIRLDELSR